MARVRVSVLIASTLAASWLGMQAVHEAGHALAAIVTGGTVRQVVLHPLTISRTDLAANPFPLLVVWAGPVFGVLLPLALWASVAVLRMPGAFVLRFFAGFCLISNGAYIGVGSFDGVGDCGEMLRHGSALWQLWLFGAVTVPAGFYLWHGQGEHFGMGKAVSDVSPAVAYGTFTVALVLALLGLWFGGE